MDARNTSGLIITTPTDREIVLTRSFAAPRGLIFEAWTTPEHVRRWWGCDKAAMTVCEIDLRVGGSWRYVLSANGEEHGFQASIAKSSRRRAWSTPTSMSRCLSMVR